MTDDKLCHLVCQKRHAEGYSLRTLAVVLGVSFSSLARLERREGNPSLVTRQRLMAWLDGRDPTAIPKPMPRLSLVLHQDIEAVVDARMKAWFAWRDGTIKFPPYVDHDRVGEGT